MNTTTLKKLALSVLAAGVAFGMSGTANAQDVNWADREGETLLMKAADRGQVAEVTRLLAAGAQVNTKDNDGETALMMAADDGNAAIVKPPARRVSPWITSPSLTATT